MSSNGRLEKDLGCMHGSGRLACLSVYDEKEDRVPWLVRFDCIAMLNTACISWSIWKVWRLSWCCCRNSGFMSVNFVALLFCIGDALCCMLVWTCCACVLLCWDNVAASSSWCGGVWYAGVAPCFVAALSWFGVLRVARILHKSLWNVSNSSSTFFPLHLNPFIEFPSTLQDTLSYLGTLIVTPLVTSN